MSSGDFSFGANPNATGGGDNNQPKPAFGGFGTGGGFSFSTPSAGTTPATTGATGAITLGSNTSTPGLNFGSNPSGAGGGLSFGLSSAPSTISAASTPLAQPSALPTATNLSFGGQGNTVVTPKAPTGISANFSLGGGGTTIAPATTVPAGGFSFGAPSDKTTIAPTLSLGGTGTGFTLGMSSSAAPTKTTPTSATTIPTSLPILGQPTSSAQLSTTTTTTQSTAIPHSMNFYELEELLNGWNSTLEEQEKAFTIQATHVNAWDKLLIENNDKIITLNDSVEKVKSEQSALEQELVHISAQHTELEECINSLQKDLSKVPQVDVERSQIYSIAENLDTQLKQMSEDLKEVIEHLNEANKAQDPNDPIVQIGRILNAHMNSLQWIEQSSSVINNKLDDISKIHDTLKRDNERSLRYLHYD